MASANGVEENELTMMLFLELDKEEGIASGRRGHRRCLL